jgi:hypothetical protein
MAGLYKPGCSSSSVWPRCQLPSPHVVVGSPASHGNASSRYVQAQHASRSVPLTHHQGVSFCTARPGSSALDPTPDRACKDAGGLAAGRCGQPPFGHQNTAQIELPRSERVSGGHLVQALAPGPENVLAGHAEQSPGPPLALKVPSEHSNGLMDPARKQEVPGGQALHEVAPTVSWK